MVRTSKTSWGQTTTQLVSASQRAWSTTGVQVPSSALQRSPGRSGCAAASRFFTSGSLERRFATLLLRGLTVET